MNDYKYYAFISYSTKDTAWGKRLQKKLEHYRMPATLCHEHGWQRKPLNPVFFAPSDIKLGALSDELKSRLRASKNLIVVCSPNSAQSDWVGKEIEYFHELGRDKNIHFFIIDGIPNSGNPTTECFNKKIKEIGLPEILGANIHEKAFRLPWLNRERAYVQLVSTLLGVEFDSIWQRHRRRLFAKIVSWLVGIAAVIAAMLLIWFNNQPFDSQVYLEEANVDNPYLPPLEEAIVSITFGDETKTDTVMHIGDAVVFQNIPHKYLGKECRVSVECPDFLQLDTLVVLKKRMTLPINRDVNVYGSIRTELWDFSRDCPAAETMVIIDKKWETTSDSAGIVHLFIPLESQRALYQIRIPEYGVTDTISMPSNEYQSVAVQR